MIKIRSNCFETNSSSTHCLVIKNDNSGQYNTTEDVFTNYDVKKNIKFHCCWSG